MSFDPQVHKNYKKKLILIAFNARLTEKALKKNKDVCYKNSIIRRLNLIRSRDEGKTMIVSIKKLKIGMQFQIINIFDHTSLSIPIPHNLTF